MIPNCCENKCSELDALRTRQSKALKIVFAINLIMFVIEFTAGLKAQSIALLGDSLDMLGDAFVYGFTLYVLYKSARMKAKAALMKGIIMLLFGLTVFGQAAYKVSNGILPAYETMEIVGSLALFANLICLWILYAHREDDINMRSTWICSRNDIIANTGTLMAAFLVGKFASIWPDVIVGTLVAGLFVTSAYAVIKEPLRILKSPTDPT